MVANIWVWDRAATVWKEHGMIETTSQVEYLNRVEAAKRCRIPVSSFDKLRRDGLVPEPDARMGKHLLWRADTIDELLARGGTGT